MCSFENLYPAYRAARRGKRGKEPAASFEHRFEEKLLQLQQELESKAYRPGRYHHFYIHRPKRRKISAAPFRDRVVHHALCRVIEPIFEKRFIHDSYACRVGKGTHRALDRCTEFARKKRYVLKGDIVQFFPSIDHEILRGLLARHIADQNVLWLIDRILGSSAGVLADEYEIQWFSGDDLLAPLRPRGLPIGNLTSQFWANVYLNELDQFVKRELGCRHYIRYVDDFLLFGDDTGELHRWRRQIMGFLVRLRLSLHKRQTVVFPVTTGIPFLGMRVYPAHRRLKKANALGFQRRLRALVERYTRGEIELERLHASLQGWVNHARYADTWGLRRSLFSTVIIRGGEG